MTYLIPPGPKRVNSITEKGEGKGRDGRDGREKEEEEEERKDAGPRGLDSSLYLVLVSFRRRPSLIHSQAGP